MKVLIACEESQIVCKSFRERGHEAYSCDIQDCSGGYPEWHIKDNVLKILNDEWDLIIAHPPCTYLSSTGNRWFNVEKYGEKALQRIRDRNKAIDFFLEFTKAKCNKIAIENPVGYMNSHYRKPDQIIQPWMFGDPYEKATCLWLKNLPKLESTHQVEPPPRVKFDSGRSMPKWYADAWLLPVKERARIRSKTFPGIAQAMAEQWG